jgi:hypothetical protein
LPCQGWRSCCHPCHVCPGLGVGYGHDITGPEPRAGALGSHSTLRLAHAAASARSRFSPGTCVHAHRESESAVCVLTHFPLSMCLYEGSGSKPEDKPSAGSIQPLVGSDGKDSSTGSGLRPAGEGSATGSGPSASGAPGTE